jgi:hypothetical protein
LPSIFENGANKSEHKPASSAREFGEREIVALLAAGRTATLCLWPDSANVALRQIGSYLGLF